MDEGTRGVIGEGADERPKGILKGLRARLDTIGDEDGTELEVEDVDEGKWVTSEEPI